MKSTLTALLVFVTSLLSFFGCATRPETISRSNADVRCACQRDDLPAKATGNLEKDLARTVHKLACGFGPRHIWNGRFSNLLATADWVSTEFRHMGFASVGIQEITVPKSLFPNHLPTDAVAPNLEVEIKGETGEIIVIGAHYDTFPLVGWAEERLPRPCEIGTPGADDNGSGVAAMLELARHFQQRFKTGRPHRTLRFVAFVNEEPPLFRTSLMGSRQYALRCKQSGENIVMMISTETMGFYRDHAKGKPWTWAHRCYMRFLGAPRGTDYVAFLTDDGSLPAARHAGALYAEHAEMPFVASLASMKASPAGWGAEARFEKAARRRVPGDVLPVPSRRWSDDASFWQHGYPGFTVTDTAHARNPHYHEATDYPKELNFKRLTEVVEGLKGMVEDLAQEQP